MKITNRKAKDNIYYDEIFKDSPIYNCGFEKSPYYNLWFEIIGMLQDKRDLLIYDVGCGTGQFLAMLEHYNYYNLIGFDFSMEAVMKAIDNTQYASVGYGNIHDKIVISDIVICCEVLEHIEKDCEVLQSWNCKQVILTVPDFDDPAHLRYFEDVDDVKSRYAAYFKTCKVVKVEKWFILEGIK